MHDCMSPLEDAPIFSAVESKIDYFASQAPADESDKTALTSHNGLFRFTRRFILLKPAPETFQPALNVTKLTGKWQ